MAHITKDRVKDTTTTTGTGNVTLSNAAPSTFRTFGSVMANNDTCLYAIVHQSANEWETGIGTYVSATPALARTTVIASSNAGALVTFSAGTKECFNTAIADYSGVSTNEKTRIFPIVTAAPTTPATDTMAMYSSKVAGRVTPHFKSPEGVDFALQPSFVSEFSILYSPMASTTVTGGYGAVWAKGGSAGVVSSPTPVTTAPALFNQMRRTRHANAVTTTNQAMGITAATAPNLSFWLGNAAGLGGFDFFCRFSTALWAANTCRLFVGLSGSATEVVISDTVQNDTCGLWHDTTDLGSGANSMNFVTRNTVTTTKTSIALSNAIAAGNVYEFEMWADRNATTIYYNLYDATNNVNYSGNTATTLPTNTTFMGPQCEMSNGTASTTVTTVAIDINRIFVSSVH